MSASPDAFLLAPERPLPPAGGAPPATAPVPPAPALRAPERPLRVDGLGPPVRLLLPLAPGRSRGRSLGRVALAPAALAALVALRLAVAVTLPIGWAAVLVAGALPAALGELYRWGLQTVARLRAHAWLPDAGPGGGAVAPAPPVPAGRGRALAWPLRLGFLLLLRYFAWWFALVVVPAGWACALALGRVPASLRRLQHAALAWLTAGDAFALLLTPRRPHLPEPMTYRRGAPVAGPATRLPPWPAAAAAWGAALAIAVSFATAVPVVVVAVAISGGEGLPAGVELVGGALQALTFVGLALVLARIHGPVRARAFGLAELAPARSLAWTAVALIAFGVLFVAALVPVAPALSIVDIVRSDDVAAVVGVLVVVAVITPVGEELFFRGFLFTALRRWKGTWVAAFVTALLFSAAHLDLSPVLFVDRLVAGFAWAMVYAKSGRLLPCILAHAVNNAVVLSLERGWEWEVPLVTGGALTACMLLVWPFCGRRARLPEAVAG